jgi:hypothetical protein
MQPNAVKPLHFHAGAGSVFVQLLVSELIWFVPIVGFAWSFNYSAAWAAKNTTIDGRKLVYKAGLGETWKFLFVQILLLIITLGIYTFWYLPKVYNYVYDHMSYDDAAAPAIADNTAPAMPPAQPVQAAAPTANEVSPTVPPSNPVL